MATKSIQYVTENYEADLALKAPLASAALTTPPIDGELSSATKQARLTEVAAEYGAGARGMQLIESWAPTVSTASKVLVADMTDWREIDIQLSNVGNGSEKQDFILQADGANTQCASRLWSTATSYPTIAVLDTWGVVTASYHIKLHKMPAGTWQFACYSEVWVGAPTNQGYTELATGRMPAMTALSIVEASAREHFVGSQTTAKIFGIADELSADVPSVGVFGASPVTYTVPYTDNAFKVAATATSKTLVTLNARQRLCGVAIDPQTAFAGTGVSAVSCSLGSATAGNEAIYLTALDAMQTDGGRASGGLYLAKDLAVPDTNREVVIHFTANTNFGDGDATVLTDGKVWVTLYTATLPDGT
jgi:hypothetical protein